MKKFISTSLVFVFLFYIFLIIAFYSTNNIVDKKSSFKLESNINSIILGHSNSECAFNDSIINNFKNLSQSGESYFYTYQKLKMVLPENEQIKTVYIEFTNSQIFKDKNEWIWGNKHMSYRYPIYAPIIDFSDNFLLAKNNLSAYQRSVSSALKLNIKRITNNNYEIMDELGGYLYLVRDKTDSLINEHNKIRSEIKKTKDFGISNSNIIYLEKIINLCKNNDINVVLVRSPQHKYLDDLKNETQFLILKDSLFSKIDFFDFNDFSLRNDEFGDFGHLNYRGAYKFSNWFNNLLEKKLNNQKDKFEFIQRMILIEKDQKVIKKLEKSVLY